MPSQPKQVHVWETVEIELHAEGNYANPYVELECWVRLRGPGFDKRVYGFWDGGNVYRVRMVAIAPGTWTWESDSNPEDTGLRNNSGTFEAIEWIETEKTYNPNRRGFLRNSANGHGLVYADGTPFFLVGDTWWAAGTWRYPFKGTSPSPDYVPGPGIGFEEAVQFRKRQGYNSVSLISCFPNWNADAYPPTLRDTREYSEYGGTPIRQAWEKNGTGTAKDMHDEAGNRPFGFPGRTDSYRDACADYDRLNPVYFQSLDRKIRYLSDEGFVPFLETVRRDHGPTWKTYYDWDVSFPRFVQYIAARYGSYNMIFSGVHADMIQKDTCLQREDWNRILRIWLERYGPLPFGQPTTILTPCCSDDDFGHGDTAPWLTMHGVGNAVRTHQMHPWVTRIFNLPNPFPCINQEPYYPGWTNSNHIPGLQPSEPGSDLQNYYARAMMYGSVLSGALTGHVFGTGAYGGDTTGEPEGNYPHIWEALKYASGEQMGLLRSFITSESTRYQELVPSRDALTPNEGPGAGPDNLDGWAYLARTDDRSLALLYFEAQCTLPSVTGMAPDKTYAARWFDPRTGEWGEETRCSADSNGSLTLPPFPGGYKVNKKDWALRLKKAAA